MSNELLFAICIALGFSCSLGAFYLGKIYLVTLISMCYLAANIFANKLILLFDYTVTAGMVMYACTVFCTDLLAEHYGVKAARKAVFVSFATVAIFIGFGYLTTLFESAAFATEMGNHLDIILSGSLRIALASLTAYIIWQLIDIKIYDLIHKKTGTKHLWLRNNGSTFISQAGGTVTFMFLAFYGVAPWIELSLVAIVFYWALAATDTLFVYLSKNITPRDHREN